MNRRKLHFPLLLLACFAYGALVVPHSDGAVHARAPLAADPPNKPCTFQNRLDIEIIGGVWFECSCEALMVGTVCDWYEITSAAQEPARKIKRAKPHHRIVIRIAHPAVVA